MKEGKGTRAIVGGAATQVAGFEKRRVLALELLGARAMSTQDLTPLLGLASPKSTQDFLRRLRDDGLISCVRLGVTHPMWMLPTMTERFVSDVASRRKAQAREKNKRRNDRYRCRKAGLDPEADMPVVQKIVTEWRPAVKRGVSSVFELAVL